MMANRNLTNLSGSKSVNADSIAVIVLNYNNYSDTVECVEGIHTASGIEVVVVDNQSPDGSGERLASYFANDASVNIVQAGCNRGYAAGNNIGIRYALNNLNTDYICILNNDTLLDVEPLRSMAAFLKSNKKCGIVGPTIIEDIPEKIVQSAGGSVNLWTGGMKLWRHGDDYISELRADACPYISGACMMFRAADFHMLGELPECYFLFFEETEWCYHAARKGLGVYCLLFESIVHKGSASISKQGSLGCYLMKRNLAIFEKRNANKVQFLSFLIVFYARYIVRRFFKGRDCRWELEAIIDGLTGQVRPEFSFVLD